MDRLARGGGAREREMGGEGEEEQRGRQKRGSDGDRGMKGGGEREKRRGTQRTEKERGKDGGNRKKETTFKHADSVKGE